MLQRYAALFASEAREQVAAATDALLALERAADAAGAAAAVDAAFRAVHTVKGMSATMGYAVVERVAHETEHVLGGLRAASATADAVVVDALLAAVDALERAVEAAVADAPPPDVEAALAALRAGVPDAAPAAPTHAADLLAPGGEGTLVRVRVAADSPLPGVRAYLALQKLEALGTALQVAPPAATFTEPGFDGRFAVRLRTDAAPDDIARAAEGAGEIAEVLVGEVAPVAAPNAPEAAPRPAARQQVRVDAARLDVLLDLVGELVTARSRLTAAAARSGDAVLTAAVAEVSRLAGALQEQVMESRLVAVAEAFDRMPRLVRDAARVTGKRIELRTEGTDVTVDRAVLDAIAEPLGHLLRNAVDHGIEDAPQRRAAGKPVAGTVTLRARRERDAICIDVEDDGGGIDRDRVLAKARARGVVDESVHALDDERLLAVLAAPGFSTKQQVTAVSGRGVGVDAVVTRVRAVGGALALRTTLGGGTCFTLRLPLTLAIARTLLAEARGATYALPLAHVRETVDLGPGTIVLDGERPAVRLRDELVPLVPLADAVQGRATGSAVDCTEAAVVEVGERRLALAVDAFAGQPDLVVKRLPGVRGALRIFGGATILDTGAVALILDVPALLARISS